MTISENTHALTVSPPQLGMDGKTFADAMVVRNAVFVVEQGVPAENELDSQEPRCWHWVVYMGPTPVGAVRLVSPPHDDGDGPDKDLDGNFLKIGRLAVDKSVRGKGIGKILVDTVVDFAHQNPDLVGPRDTQGKRIDGQWDGRILAHAQTKVKTVWEKLGFVVDPNFEEWVEEEILHCAMWMKPTDSAEKREPSLPVASE